MPLLPLKAGMQLAQPRIDIGFATNNARAVWQNEIGLPFGHTQPTRRGYNVRATGAV